MDFTRQDHIWDPTKQRINLVIVGAGSTGSFIALTLAKMGFETIRVIDFDIVDYPNIPNQFYKEADVERMKVDALQDVISDFTGTSIYASPIKVDEQTPITDYVDANTVLIICVDNMGARKLIFEQLKETPVKILDTRMGGQGFSLHYCDCTIDADKIRYEQSVNLETMETPCGEKAIIYTVLAIASETCNIVRMIDREEIVPRIVKREMKQYRFIADI